MYRIKLDDACTMFSLYRNGRFLGSSPLVGSLLETVALCYGVDISECMSESHQLAVLQETIDIEVEDV